MKAKEILLIVLLYVIVGVATFFCYKKMFGQGSSQGQNGENPSDNNTKSGENQHGMGLNEILKVGDKVQCIGNIALRSSAEFNDGLFDNIVKKDAKGQLGTVLEKIVKDEIVWCKVELFEPVWEWLLEYTEVYVLESEITKI